ncbi:galactose mutarotase [Flammeovirga aprica JL-4]|uniref:Aldose 1-epimerase n=1 Tax=Flammeovirga aprica JL-4 TaxID=694437 RepID=A0A7X9RYP1_9BACT|nr:galactose mutarotase [Flammeovirga aprica JL-4]
MKCDLKFVILLLVIIVPGTLFPNISECKNRNDFKIIELRNGNGQKVEIANYGARIVSWYVKDNQDHLRNIVLGFSTKKQYQKADAPFYSAIVGRYANRIENFTLEGKEYHLTDDDFILHGGAEGFHQKMWKIKKVTDNAVVLSVHSKDGEAGFPGNLKVEVEYVLTESNELKINYKAETDQATPVNLTNHAFFNLKGAGNGTVLDLLLKVNADQYTPLKKGGLPTGEIASVENTVFDFREFKKVSKAVNSTDAQIKLANGLDHNFVNKEVNTPLITAIDPTSGIKLEMTTTLPGVQIYTANFLTGNDKSDEGKAFKARESICFEAQFFANSPQHSNFPNTILKAGEVYKHSTTYKVSVVNSNE